MRISWAKKIPHAFHTWLLYKKNPKHFFVHETKTSLEILWEQFKWWNYARKWITLSTSINQCLSNLHNFNRPLNMSYLAICYLFHPPQIILCDTAVMTKMIKTYSCMYRDLISCKFKLRSWVYSIVLDLDFICITRFII